MSSADKEDMRWQLRQRLRNVGGRGVRQAFVEEGESFGFLAFRYDRVTHRYLLNLESGETTALPKGAAAPRSIPHVRMIWQANGLFCVREHWPNRRTYEYELGPQSAAPAEENAGRDDNAV